MRSPISMATLTGIAVAAAVSGPWAQGARPGDLRPFVVGLAAKDGDEPTCSGVVVGRCAVATAAHCVVGEPPLRVQLADGTARNVVRVRSHPGYRLSNDGEPIDDVAVLGLDAPVPGDPLPIDLGDGASWSGGAVAAAGVAGGAFRQSSAYARPRGVAAFVTHDGGRLCHGDSGGPVAAWRGRRWVLVGLTSATVDALGGCSRGLIHVRTAAHASFFRAAGVFDGAGGCDATTAASAARL